MSNTVRRRLTIGAVMLVALIPISLVAGLAIKAYTGWLFSWYNPQEEYAQVYEEQREDGKSPLAADTDAGCAAILPGLGGVLLILIICYGGGEFLAYKGGDWLWRNM